MQTRKEEKKIPQQTRERVRRLREKRRQEIRRSSDEDTASPSTPTFPNRMAKNRAMKKTVEAMPKTPVKKVELFETISSSPRTRKVLQKKGVIKSPEEIKETVALRALTADISEGAEHFKRSRSKNTRAVYSAFKHLAFGQNVAKARAKKDPFHNGKLGTEERGKGSQRAPKNIIGGEKELALSRAENKKRCN